MAPPKTALHAYLSEESLTAWRFFAETNGVTVTGLLEALANEIAAEVSAAGDPALVRQDWIAAARKVDAERRRRSVHRNGR